MTHKQTSIKMYARGYQAAHSKCCNAHHEMHIRTTCKSQYVILTCEKCGKPTLTACKTPTTNNWSV